jgi:hypothetical protein
VSIYTTRYSATGAQLQCQHSRAILRSSIWFCHHNTLLQTPSQPLMMSSNQYKQIMDRTPAPQLMASLKSQVEIAIAPYASSKSVVPPFTVAEIMVMAWVCRKKPSFNFISDKEVSDWTFLTFGYYREMALEELYEHGFQECENAFKERSDFHDLVFQRTIQLERMEVPLEVRRRNGEAGYSSTLPGARRFLNRKIGGELTTFGNFFKLPVEIRVLIYENVFFCHVDGLQYNDAEFQPKSKVRGLRLSQRGKRPCWDYQEDFTRTGVSRNKHWSLRENYPSATEQTSRLMALLLVNRQIFEEAMPVFYGINHIHATSLLELTNMLKHCGERRRPHFTSISVSYARSVGPRTAIKAFKLLKDVKRLRRLEIETSDTDFRQDSKYGPLDSSKVPQLPGIKILSSIRVRELHFAGNCPVIEAYLRQTMEIKAGDEDKGSKGKARGKGKSRKSAKTVVEDADDARSR